MPSPANRQPPQWGDSAPVRHEMTARVPQPITSGDRFPRQRDHFLKVVSWRTTPTILNGPAHARQTRAEVKLEFVLSNLKGNAPGPAWAFAHVGHCWRMRMPWPAPDLSIENLPRLLDRVAGPQHAFNTLIILRPLLNLVEVALICVERVVGLLDSPISSRGTPRHIDRHPTRYTATQFKNWGITKTCWSLVAPPEEAAPAPLPNCNGNTSRKRFPTRSARIFRPPRAAYSGSYRIGASERLHSNLPIPVLALQYPKPVALDGLVFDGDRIVSRCPYAIVAAQFHVLEF